MASGQRDHEIRSGYLVSQPGLELSILNMSLESITLHKLSWFWLVQLNNNTSIYNNSWIQILSLDDSYPERDFQWFSLVPQGNCWENFISINF
jgi:hypothetical protein